MDSVQDIYDFFQSDVRLFAASSLYRLLKHFELRMNSQLRTLFTVSDRGGERGGHSCLIFGKLLLWVLVV